MIIFKLVSNYIDNKEFQPGHSREEKYMNREKHGQKH